RRSTRIENVDELRFVHRPERLRAPDDREMPRFAEAAQKVEEVDETEEIVLEPKHHFVLAASVIEEHLLIEQLGARAQQILIVILGEKSRPVLDPIMLRQARANGTGDQRLAKRDVPAG